MSRVLLGLGSNLGNRENNIKSALKLINRLPFTSVDTVSDFYYNPAMYGAVYDFVNAVALIYTLLEPYPLLRSLKEIEKALGRREKGGNLPRIIDIDILAYDNVCISTPELTIPHPRMKERDFVMKPLKEILTRFPLSDFRFLV